MSIVRTLEDRAGPRETAAAEAPRRLARLLAACAAVVGLCAWSAYACAGLVLSHYDARAHLVVARRVFDSLTPGWKQIGAVWLPLPHLINLVPTQVDLLYRTGAFASLISIICLIVTVWAAVRLTAAITGSPTGATIAAALVMLNPNLIYLYVTPMTEPLLLAVTLVSLLWLYEWTAGDMRHVPRKLALALFAAAWTRYEAWPVLAAGIAAAGFARWRNGSGQAGLKTVVRLAAPPLVALLLFMLNSRASVGAWFVSGGFYVPDPLYDHRPDRALLAVWWGAHELGGYAIEIAAVCGIAILAGTALRDRRQSPRLVPLALVAAAALPVYAFYEGHPFRVRYMIPAAAACALFAGGAVGLLDTHLRARGRGRAFAVVAGALLLVSSVVESPPFRRGAPMVAEAVWDQPSSQGRRQVTNCLRPFARGQKILASMGSLAHYMHELSAEGFDLSDFIHEGNGAIWEMALGTGPAPHAAWMLVEEESEGGDVLARRLRADASFAHGMTRMCQGGGVALYRRD